MEKICGAYFCDPNVLIKFKEKMRYLYENNLYVFLNEKFTL